MSQLLRRKELLESANGRTREALLQEAMDRFEYFFKDIDGDFEYAKCNPQIQQVLVMIAMASVTKEQP